MRDVSACLKGQGMKTVRDLMELLYEQGLLVQQVNAETDKDGTRPDRAEKRNGGGSEAGIPNGKPHTGGRADRKMEREITWVTYDSRKVIQGAVFVCKGASFERKYLEDAVAAGCAAWVADRKTMEQIFAKMEDEVPGFVVSDIRKAMAVIAADFSAMNRTDLF